MKSNDLDAPQGRHQGVLLLTLDEFLARTDGSAVDALAPYPLAWACPTPPLWLRNYRLSLFKELAMSDDKTETVDERNVIHLSEPYEVRDWTNSLGITEVELREAVAAVGSSADKVRQYLATQ